MDIGTAAEQSALESALFGDQWWIGIRYAGGRWQWLDGSSPGYENWGFKADAPGLCGFLGSTGRWGSLPCSTPGGKYICEAGI